MTSLFQPRCALVIKSVALVATATVFVTPVTRAADLSVCARGCEFKTIQAAVDAAHHGDVIGIGPGTYFENVKVAKALTLSGAGSDKTRVDGQLLGPVFSLDGPPNPSGDVPIVIKNMTITHGRGIGIGGGVEVTNLARLEMHTCIVIGNRSDGDASGAGGGINIESQNGVPNEIVDSEVVDNHSHSGGGGIAVSFESLATISNSTIARNDTPMLGGGILVLQKGSTAIKNTSLTENRAGFGGGVGVAAGNRFEPEAQVTIDSSIIADNSSSNDGGGIFGSVVKISNSVIARNKAGGNGGGWLEAGLPPQLTNMFVIQNTAGQDGGGILTSSPLTLTGTTIAQNHPDDCEALPPVGGGCP